MKQSLHGPYSGLVRRIPVALLGVAAISVAQAQLISLTARLNDGAGNDNYSLTSHQIGLPLDGNAPSNQAFWQIDGPEGWHRLGRHAKWFCWERATATDHSPTRIYNFGRNGACVAYDYSGTWGAAMTVGPAPVTAEGDSSLGFADYSDIRDLANLGKGVFLTISNTGKLWYNTVLESATTPKSLSWSYRGRGLALADDSTPGQTAYWRWVQRIIVMDSGVILTVIPNGHLLYNRIINWDSATAPGGLTWQYPTNLNDPCIMATGECPGQAFGTGFGNSAAGIKKDGQDTWIEQMIPIAGNYLLLLWHHDEATLAHCQESTNAQNLPTLTWNYWKTVASGPVVATMRKIQRWQSSNKLTTLPLGPESYAWPLSVKPATPVDFSLSRVGSNGLSVKFKRFTASYLTSANLDTQGYLPHLGEALNLPSGSVATFNGNHVPVWHSGDRSSIPVVDEIVKATPIDADENGFNWSPTYRLVPPSSWLPGFYALSMETAGGSSLVMTPFIVRGPADASIAVLANTNTWQAYNNGKYLNENGGQYSFQRPSDPNVISFSSPSRVAALTKTSGNASLGGLAGEVFITAWLDGLANSAPDPSTYKYKLLTDSDFEQEGLSPDTTKVLIIHVHPEYWSLAMRRNLTSYLLSGGKVLYLGGNGMFELCETCGPSGTALRFGKTLTEALGSAWQPGNNLRNDRSDYAFRNLDLQQDPFTISLLPHYPSTGRASMRSQAHPWGLTINGYATNGNGVIWPVPSWNPIQLGVAGNMYEGGLWGIGCVVPSDDPPDAIGPQGQYLARYFPYTVTSPHPLLWKPSPPGGNSGAYLEGEIGRFGPTFKGRRYQASGWERDGLDLYASQFQQHRGLTLLAHAENDSDIVYQTYPNGGFVFSAGSMTFTACLFTDAQKPYELQTLHVMILNAINAGLQTTNDAAAKTAYAAWATASGLPSADSAAADPDGDGAPNLMEFLNHTDPFGFDNLAPLSFVGNPAQLQLALPNDWTSPVTVLLQSSTDLNGGWLTEATKGPSTAWATNPPMLSPTTNGKVAVSFANGGRKFWRLKFSLESGH
jgi:hypothetical protein